MLVEKKTKKTKVLEYLLNKGYITHLQALGLFGHYRLAVTISSLRKEGHIIHTAMRRDVEGRSYARYYYIGRRI